MIFLDLKWLLVSLIIKSCTCATFAKSANSAKSPGQIRRVILDVDVGLDDAVALFVFLHADELKQIKIEAITCCNGNTSVDNVCKNVARILEIYRRTDIPVYRGASRPLIVNKYSLDFGHDGFGDLKYGREPYMGVIKNTSAPVAIYDLVKAHPNEISIIALAPLTNIALAIKTFDDFIPNVKDLYIMGGSYGGTSTGTASAEYNFYVDPESARIVFDSYKRPISLLIWQTCLKTTLTRNWMYNVLGKSIHPAFYLLVKAEKQVHPPSDKKWSFCDPMLAVAYLYPDEGVVNKTTSYYATVELHGELTRGELVLDSLKGREPNVTIINEINQEFYEKLLLQMAGLND